MTAITPQPQLNTDSRSQTVLTTMPTTATHEPAFQDTTETTKRISVLMCGQTDLEAEGMAGLVYVADHLGRRKLKGLGNEVLNSRVTTDVLWMTPKKYWTVSKSSINMQDTFLDVADAYIANNKDVVIVAQKDYGWINRDPRKIMHKFETPSRVVLCTRKLDLAKDVGSSDDALLLNIAIAKSLNNLLTDRVGVRQSYPTSQSTNSASTIPDKKTRAAIPKIEQPKSSHRSFKQGSRSPKPTRERQKKAEPTQRDKTDRDEYDLGDHATNDDKPTAKPNYAKEYNKDKQKQGKKLEKGTDDCGDDVTAIDLDDNVPLAAFADFEELSTVYQSSNECSQDADSEDECQEMFFSSIDDLCTFVNQEDSCHVMVSDSFSQTPYFSYEWRVKKVNKRTKHDTMHVMEIFGGYGGVTRIAIRRGLATGKMFDLNVGIDLTNPGEKAKLIRYIHEHKPEVVVMGPPCTAFSGWARYNMMHAFDAWSRSYAIGLPLATLAAEVAEIQLQAGRHFLAENPWSSTIWSLPAWQKILPYCFVAYCEQCVFGLCDAAGEPTLKPTAFVSSSEILVERLRQECNGRHLKHALLAGSLWGVSKTSYAQQWPKKLCEAIVQSIEKLCGINQRTSQSYVGGSSSSSSTLPSRVTCPGCRSHAYRRSPRHTRVEGECNYPHDTPDVLTCSACLRNLSSYHPTHTRADGCHWSEAMPRLGSTRTTSANPSRGPQPTKHIIPDAPISAPSAPAPPETELGKWRPVEDLETISALEDVAYFDGWHNWQDGSKALVSTNTRYMREPQPRYTNDMYPLRSTFGQFMEHSHVHGNWYQLEDHVVYQGLTRIIGYPVERLVNVFHPGIVTASSTEKKIEDDAPAPKIPEIPNSIDEGQSQSVVKRKRVRLDPTPTEVQPQEYGDEEIEIPEIAVGKEVAVRSEDGTVAVPEEPEAIEPVDWTTMDLGTTFRELKSEDRSLITRALRKLHLRWWHAPATRMSKLLTQAGAPQLALNLVKDVCDTCRICRAWKRPTAKSMSHVTQASKFNERVQLDLLFVADFVILHLCDECTKFSMAEVIKSRETTEILGSIRHSWIKYFDVPQLFVSDSEGALGSEEAAIWAERLGTSFKLLPRGSHATVVERHHETLRQLIHRIGAQLKIEGLTLNMSDIVSEAIRAKNSLLVINGFTPYQAVLGRTPNLLGEHETPSVSMIADSLGGVDAKHSTRLREIAVAAMVEGSAQERIKRAKETQTRVSGEQLELAVNDLVDVYRTPRTKDNVGWRGPAKVVSVAGLEQGHVEVQWGGRVMSCRIQDVRKALMYPAMLQTEDHAFEMIRHHAMNLVNTCDTYAMVYTPKGWQLSQAAARNPGLFYAVLRVAHDMFQMPRCIGGRVGRGVSHTKGLFGTDTSIVVWWPCNNPQLYRSMSCSALSDLNLKELFGEDWINQSWIRFFGVEESMVTPVRRVGVDIPYLGGEPGDPRQPPAPPATPVPMDEDDVTINDRASQSTATRIVTPMSTDRGGPPPPPAGASRNRHKTPVSTDRSRSRYAPSNTTETPISSIHQTPQYTPINTDTTSNRATDATDETRYYPSPRGEKRTPTPIASNQSDRPQHKQHRTNQTSKSTASASTAEPQTHHNAPTVQLPTTEDDADDDATIQQTDDETETDLYTLLSPWKPEELEELEPWDCMFSTKYPPPQHHVWEVSPAIEEVCLEQEHYLMQATETQKHQDIRSCAVEKDFPELEIGPNMAAWFVGAPELQPDEILVFTSNSASPQIEKNYDALTPQDIKKHHQAVTEAIRKEIGSFVEHKTFTRAFRRDCKNICTSRWVLRWKEIDGKRCIKARLTIRGFQDLAEVPSYASTASRWTQRLVISIAAQKNWRLFVADVSTAFLRGMSFEELSRLTGTEVRDVAFTPPKGSEKFFTELKGYHDLNFATEVLKLLKAVYGLRDAPRAWRLRLDIELRKLGGVPLPTDNSLYCFYSEGKELEALISTHVDDLKGCGTEARTKKILDGLTSAFGKLKLEYDNFTHCGLKHERLQDGYKINQDHYAEQLRCIDTSSLDLTLPDKLLSEEFLTSFLSLLGGLGWLIQTRLDIAIYVCALQRAAKRATTGHVLKLNKLTKWVRRKKFSLVYRRLAGPCKLLTISDSAFKTEPNSALAMRGALIGICSEGPASVGGTYHILEFYAKKQRRVCRSTFAAELNGIADAVEIARLINLTITCLYQPFVSPLELQKLEDTGRMPLAIEVCTDCRSVFDALAAEDTRTPSESSLVLILHVIKELLRAHVIKKLTWVHTDDMLADGLTKGGVSRRALFECASAGCWTLKHETKTHTEKKVQPVNRTFMMQISKGLSRLTNAWFS